MQTLRVIQKSHEYNQSLSLAFMDNRTINIDQNLNSVIVLQNAISAYTITPPYQTVSRTSARINHTPEKSETGDVIYTKLLTTVPKNLKLLDCKKLSININDMERMDDRRLTKIM